uniref:Thioredoxin-like_fold domain-containing protein n=1 Tax=Macrostomum lignano TaxID=282301 RepID=A0A1I8FL02_9PLAT
MFPGDYMLAFRDGFLMFRILEEALKANGESAEAILEKYETYKATKRRERPPTFRACYWYVCTNFVHKWPIQYQVAFFVDCCCLRAAQGIKVSIEPPWPTTRTAAKEATQKSK